MADEVHETIRRDGAPRHRLRVWAPDEAWRQENGRPGWASFTIWEVDGEQADGTLLFTTAAGMATTSDPDNAISAARGTVTWTGCCNYEMGDETVMFHACGPDDLDDLATALRRAYHLAAVMVGAPDAEEPGQPPPHLNTGK